MTRAELVEAMARAICAEDAECGPWDMAPRILREALRDEARAALAAIEAAGFAVVPREATVAMVMAATGRPQPDPEPLMYPAIYLAMVAASPVEARDE
jgi:hypothetical protein